MFDYWHIQRYLELDGADPDEPLPFGEPPIVIGSLISIPEPIWRTLAATSVANGAPDLFEKWSSSSELSASDAEAVRSALDRVIPAVELTLIMTYPPDLYLAEAPDARSVIRAMLAVRDLLILAESKNSSVRTWSE